MTDHLRNEVAADALLDRDDELAYEASRNEALGLEPGYVSTREMRARWAADRAAVEAPYDPRDFGWWNSEDDE